MRPTTVHAYAIATPFGTLAYKLGSPNNDPDASEYRRGELTMWGTPAGDANPADVIVPMTSAVFTPGSTGVDEEATYLPRDPGSIIRYHKPLKINGKQYTGSFNVTRRANGEWLRAQAYGFGNDFTDAAARKLCEWLTEHDSEVYGAHEKQEREDDARNDHAAALDALDEANAAATAALTRVAETAAALRNLAR